MKKYKGVIFYECINPYCRFLLTKAQYDYAKYNYPCPKCNKTLIEEFKKVEK